MGTVDYSKDYYGNPQTIKAESFDGDVDGDLDGDSSGTHTGAIVVPTGTPASAGATGVAGSIKWDASYIYVCVATNTWKRAAIATW